MFVKASDGQVALELVKAHANVALVFADIKMPNLNGLEVAAILARFRPEIPIVLVSGYLDKFEYSDITPKPYALVAKPFRLAEIIGIAKEILERSA